MSVWKDLAAFERSKFIALTATELFRPQCPNVSILAVIVKSLYFLDARGCSKPLRSKIVEMLENYKIEKIPTRISHQSKVIDTQDGDDEGILTLVIRASVKDTEEENQWLHARRVIRYVFNDNKIKVHEESIKPDWGFHSGLFPLLPEDDYHKVYKSFKKRMVADIELALGESWAITTLGTRLR